MEKGRLNREVWGVVISLTAFLIIISLLSYSPNDRSLNTPSALIAHNWGGFAGFQLFLPGLKGLRVSKAVGYAVLLVGIAVLLSLLIDSEDARESGGVV